MSSCTEEREKYIERDKSGERENPSRALALPLVVGLLIIFLGVFGVFFSQSSNEHRAR